MSPFFSVIMPVFNGEKYLSKAIKSVLRQTYSGFELIIVDDCSTDNTWNIIEKFANTDQRVIPCQTEQNKGVSNARNKGIEYVHGKYLTFIDADDYVEADLFRLVKARIDETSASLVKCSAIEEYLSESDEIEGSKKVILSDILYASANEVRNAILPMERKPLFGYLWNSFYSMEVFPREMWKFDLNMKVNEDFMMNMKLIDRVECMACMSYCGYHYAKRKENSLSTKKNDEYYSCSIVKIQVLCDKYKQWNLYNRENRLEILWLYIRVIYSTICRIQSIDGIAAASKKWDILRKSSMFSKLYHDCSNDEFENTKMKIMWNLLRKNRKFLIFLLVIGVNLIKNNMRVVFSKIKE